MPTAGRRADPGLLALAVALGARLAWLAPRLLVDDLNLDYPFAAGDAWDWIANGLFYAGAPVRWSARPPLVPLALAGLAGAGWLEAWPLLAQALWTAALLALYLLLRRRWSAGVALAATAVIAASHTLNLLSLEIGADLPATCLILLALAALAAAAERPAWFLAAGGLGAAAALASPIGLVVLPAGAAAEALGRRRWRSVWPWLGAALPVAAAAGGWLIHRALLDGDPPLHELRRLVRPHLDDLDGTLWTAAVVVGWPALLLALGGGAIALRRVLRRRDPDGLRAAALVATVLPFVFFAVVYDFPDRRFLAYPALPAAVLVAEGLGALRPKAARALAGIAAVALAAWPPVPRAPLALPVLPPSLYLQAPAFGTPEGASRVEPARAGWRLIGIGRAAAESWPARVAEAHAADEAAPAAERAARRRARETAAEAARAVDSVLFLDSAHRADRYRIQSQLGNALRRRVRFVPEDLFAGRWEWLAAGGVAPAGEVAGATLWRVEPPGLGGPWLLATQAGPLPSAPPPTPLSTATDVAPPAEVRAPSRPPAGRDHARRLAAALPGPTRLVALLLPDGPPPSAALWLPFLVDTTELYVLRPSDIPRDRPLFDDPAPAAADARFGPLRLTQRRWRGEAVAVVEVRWAGPGVATP